MISNSPEYRCKDSCAGTLLFCFVALFASSQAPLYSADRPKLGTKPTQSLSKPSLSEQNFWELESKYLDLMRAKKYQDAGALVKSAYARAKNQKNYSSNPIESFSNLGLFSRYCYAMMTDDTTINSHLKEMETEYINLLKLKAKLPSSLDDSILDTAWRGLSQFRKHYLLGLSKAGHENQAQLFQAKLDAIPWYASMRDRVGKRSLTLLSKFGSARIVLPPDWMSLGELKEDKRMIQRIEANHPGKKGIEDAEVAKEVLSTLLAVDADATISFDSNVLKEEEITVIDKFIELKGKGIIKTPANKLPRGFSAISNEFACIDGHNGNLIYFCQNAKGGTVLHNYTFHARNKDKSILLSFYSLARNGPELFSRIRSNFMNTKFLF